jgi:hypothetical protein
MRMGSLGCSTCQYWLQCVCHFSAGGTGVMVNLDPVADLLNAGYGLSHIMVRGVSDSGWFLDRAPYSQDGHSLAPLDAVKKGIRLWQGQVPLECQARYPSEPWRCYFGYRAYPTLTSEFSISNAKLVGWFFLLLFQGLTLEQIISVHCRVCN